MFFHIVCIFLVQKQTFEHEKMYKPMRHFFPSPTLKYSPSHLLHRASQDFPKIILLFPKKIISWKYTEMKILPKKDGNTEILFVFYH